MKIEAELTARKASTWRDNEVYQVNYGIAVCVNDTHYYSTLTGLSDDDEMRMLYQSCGQSEKGDEANFWREVALDIALNMARAQRAMELANIAD